MNRTSAGWTTEFQRQKAIWRWIDDGRNKKPHALFTSGLHSNCYFNSQQITSNPELVEQACSDLLEMLFDKNEHDLEGVNRVVGPAMGAIIIAHEIAKGVSSYTEKTCRSSFAEEIVDGRIKKRVFNRSKINPLEKVLLCEDVITTGNSVLLTRQAVIEEGGIPFDFVLTLVNRSNKTVINGMKIISLINHPSEDWLPEQCPLCKNGSQAIRPREGENWTLLNS